VWQALCEMKARKTSAGDSVAWLGIAGPSNEGLEKTTAIRENLHPD
jgi:hypothetical protein